MVLVASEHTNIYMWCIVSVHYVYLRVYKAYNSLHLVRSFRLSPQLTNRVRALDDSFWAGTLRYLRVYNRRNSNNKTITTTTTKCCLWIQCLICVRWSSSSKQQQQPQQNVCICGCGGYKQRYSEWTEKKTRTQNWRTKKKTNKQIKVFNQVNGTPLFTAFIHTYCAVDIWNKTTTTTKCSDVQCAHKCRLTRSAVQHTFLKIIITMRQSFLFMITYVYIRADIFKPHGYMDQYQPADGTTTKTMSNVHLHTCVPSVQQYRPSYQLSPVLQYEVIVKISRRKKKRENAFFSHYMYCSVTLIV